MAERGIIWLAKSYLQG